MSSDGEMPDWLRAWVDKKDPAFRPMLRALLSCLAVALGIGIVWSLGQFAGWLGG